MDFTSETSEIDLRYGVFKRRWSANNESGYDTSLTTKPYKRRRHIEALDLTIDTIYCTGCPRALGEGDEDDNAIYTLDDCGCMFCGDCIPCEYNNSDGNKAPMKLFKVPGVFCSREDHLTTEAQSAYRTWGLECAICSKSLADLYGTEKPRLDCGHWFCNDCIQEHIKWEKEQQYNQLRCPICRKAMMKGRPVIFLRAIPRTIRMNVDNNEA
ncbi:hypothetical protein BCON_0083g00350 [Botryotinia convoluta]|uniref:RING-type domain-containing protein n=1 Tax=Botryotinia convoluta TaxID=54673 RepID=A0A4Z1I983_9HELO|nr:hypothetical protein BCON_0083g00350 [Botryotinia convoluta]